MPSNLDATAWTLLVLVLVLAVSFDFINGFHDTANAIATVVATRVLSAGVAIMMAAVLNFVGALTGQAVAKTVTSGLVDPKAVQGLGFQMGQVLVMAALIGAIIWNLLTWYFGIPSSSNPPRWGLRKEPEQELHQERRHDEAYKGREYQRQHHFVEKPFPNDLARAEGC